MPKLSNTTALVELTDCGTTSHASAGIACASVSITIFGKLTSLKNSRRIVRNRRTFKPMSIKSKAAIDYMAEFLAQIPHSAKRQLGSQSRPLRAIVSVWYPSWKADLDCALVYDLLQLAGVVANDRWIREKTEYAHIDKANPRIEVLIEEL